MRRGRLVVFEGVEGAGKTTQVARLRRALEARGVGVTDLREPGGTLVGDQIRRLLLDPATELAPAAEALLFMASRAQLVEQVVRPALARGQVVLLDRFFLSTYAYQVAGRRLPEPLVRDANRLATRDVTGGTDTSLVPDVNLLLAFPVAQGLDRATRRGARDRIEGEDPAFHARVEEAFAAFGDPAWQAAHPEAGPVAVVDASGAEDVVAARVWAAVVAHCPELAA